MVRFVLGWALFVGAAGGVAFSQDAAVNAAAAGGAGVDHGAADPTQGIAFDVVSIRHTEQGPSRVTNAKDGDGITIRNSTLREIMEWNYGLRLLRPDQIKGAPEWFSGMDDNYEIHAKVAPQDVAAWQKLDDEARRLVFRKVLADRFKLACHLVYVDVPVYNLVIGKHGLKIKEAKAGDSGVPSQGAGMTTRMTQDGQTWVFKRTDMASFVRGPVFKYGVDRPVYDKTGLTGMYTFTLEYSWDRLYASLPGESRPAPMGTDLFTALQQQLGLKLVSARGPEARLFVDHVERPSDN